MAWSVEDLEDGRYGLVLTNGQKSRTVFLAFNAGDAANFIQMAEVYSLLSGGAPVELFQAAPKGRKSVRSRK